MNTHDPVIVIMHLCLNPTSSELSREDFEQCLVHWIGTGGAPGSLYIWPEILAENSNLADCRSLTSFVFARTPVTGYFILIRGPDRIFHLGDEID